MRVPCQPFNLKSLNRTLCWPKLESCRKSFFLQLLCSIPRLNPYGFEGTNLPNLEKKKLLQQRIDFGTLFAKDFSPNFLIEPGVGQNMEDINIVFIYNFYIHHFLYFQIDYNLLTLQKRNFLPLAIL